MKAIVLVLILSFSTLIVAENQEVIKTVGVGISDTKISACEMALDYARREAAQTATVQVESEFSSVISNSSVQYHEDRLLTTKAFARVIKRQEKASFDEGSGLIRCKVSASFKVGFIRNVPERVMMSKASEQFSMKQAGSNSSEDITQDFKAGNPFCSKKMSLCFREIYSKQLREFGIQVLPPGYWRSEYFKSLDNKHYNYFFNKVSNRPNKGDVVTVSTKEALLELIDKKGELAFLYINRHKWSGKHGGFLNRRENSQRIGYPYGKKFKPIMLMHQKPGFFDSLDVSKEYLKELDDEMSKVNQELSDIC
jgi:hypothetical protein